MRGALCWPPSSGSGLDNYQMNTELLSMLEPCEFRLPPPKNNEDSKMVTTKHAPTRIPSDQYVYAPCNMAAGKSDTMCVATQVSANPWGLNLIRHWPRDPSSKRRCVRRMGSIMSSPQMMLVDLHCDRRGAGNRRRGYEFSAGSGKREPSGDSYF